MLLLTTGLVAAGSSTQRIVVGISFKELVKGVCAGVGGNVAISKDWEHLWKTYSSLQGSSCLR